MSLDLTAYDPILKSHYVKKRIYPLADLKNPTLGMIPKNTKGGGKHIIQPIDYENPQGGSATIATAITNTGASKYEDFVLLRKKNYQIAKIDNETMEASRTDENAFMPAFKEVDKAFKQAGRALSVQLFRTAGGAIGRLETGTTLAAAVISLDDHADGFNFQVGMEIVFSDTNGTGSLRDSGEAAGVIAVNRAGGTVTVDVNLDTIASIADTDYIFREGDYGLCLSGFADWLPSTPPDATAFFGVARNVDDRLYGVIRTASGEPLTATVQKLISEIVTYGGSPDYVVMNPNTLSNLLLLLEGRSRYEPTKMSGRAKIGFKGFTFAAGGLDVTAYGDVSCPTNRLYALQMDTWTLHSAGDAPMFLNRDGLLLRGATTDDYEVRVGHYAQLGCSAPCFNGVGVLS